IFLGTDDGLYISTNAGGNWLKYTNGFPTAPVKDLVVHPRENDLVIGTFGRAAWVLDDIRPLRAIAKAPSILYEKLKVFNPPTAYRTAYQQPSGSRFGGDAIYNGENRGRGAVISYYFKAAEKTTAEPGDKKPMKDKDSDDEREGEKETKGPGKDSIYMKIYDGTRLIRTLKRKIPDSTGIYKWTWFLDEAGTGRPSRTLRKRKREPGGTGAKPGTYRVVMEHDGKQTETQLKVESDPRLHIPQKAIDDRYSASKQLEKMTQTAAGAVKQLVESKTAVEGFGKKLKKEGAKKYKAEIKAGKAISKKIEEQIALYIGKVDKRQGITRNPKITTV
ncbi:MAG: hypothetical protein ACPGU0_09600, partial [Marinirhabdus sp.]